MRPVAPHSIRVTIAIAVAFRTRRVHVAQEHPMLDIVMLALGLGFFVAGIGYAYACERL